MDDDYNSMDLDGVGISNRIPLSSVTRVRCCQGDEAYTFDLARSFVASRRTMRPRFAARNTNASATLGIFRISRCNADLCHAPLVFSHCEAFSLVKQFQQGVFDRFFACWQD